MRRAELEKTEREKQKRRKDSNTAMMQWWESETDGDGGKKRLFEDIKDDFLWN